MIAAGTQARLLLLSSIGLALFLMVHSALVDVDFEACLANYGASINGARPYPMVGEMSFRALVLAVEDRLSPDDLAIAALGLFSLSPFAVAWGVSKNARWRRFWVLCAMVSLAIIVVGTCWTGLAGFYDCEQNGMGLGMVLAPIAYTMLNLAVTLGIVATRFLMRVATRF